MCSAKHPSPVVFKIFTDSLQVKLACWFFPHLHGLLQPVALSWLFSLLLIGLISMDLGFRIAAALFLLVLLLDFLSSVIPCWSYPVLIFWVVKDRKVAMSAERYGEAIESL